MRKTEQKLWDRMRKHLGHHARLERVENLVYVGTPDVLALVAGVVTPVELKAVQAFPKRITTPVLGAKGLSQDQKNWHKDWQRWGGRSFVLVGVGPAAIYLFDGAEADYVNDYTALAYSQVAWEEVLSQLRKDRR